MPQMIADDVTGPNSQYAKPELVAAGKGADGKPTFYMVVNEHGLKELANNGLFSTVQIQGITREFDVIPLMGDGETRKGAAESQFDFRNRETDQPSQPQSTATTGDRLLSKTDSAAAAIVNVLDTSRLFIVEVKKDGDRSEATRIFSGKYSATMNEDGNPVNPATIEVHNTFNLLSPGLPKQSVQDLMLTIDRKIEKAIPPIQRDSVMTFVIEELKEQNAQSFLQAVDAKRDKFAQAETLPPAMRDALAKASDKAYTPATPDGYEGLATGGAGAKPKTVGKSAA